MIQLEAQLDKWYGARRVLNHATLSVAAGSVHALVGENGAGKSTLVGIVAGMVRANAGMLRIGETDIALATWTPARARALGVGIVLQHGSFAGSLRVVENAVLGSEPVRRGVLDLEPTAAALRALGGRLGWTDDPWAVVDRLTPGQAQRAEIVAAVHTGAKLLILDEPTAVLTPIEVTGLLHTLQALARSGTTIVLVTHKLDEVKQVADAVTVLRDGATVATFGPGAPAADIVRAMVPGADVSRLAVDGVQRSGVQRAVPVAASLATADVSRPDADRGAQPRNRPALVLDRLGVRGAVEDVSLAIAAGELVGVAGVDGNGQRELALAIAGLVPHTGRVHIGSRDVSGATTAARLAAGLAHIPDDRHRGGLILDDSVAHNLALGRRDITGRFIVDRARVAAHADAQIAALDIRPPDRDAVARTLSGGNQQKLVIGRELSRPSLIAVVASQPTRGLDLAAVARIRDRLRDVAAADAGVLVISADLDELLVLCDRVVVMLRGRLVGERTGEALDRPAARTELGELMTGAVTA